MAKNQNSLLSMGVGLAIGTGIGYLASLFIPDKQREHQKKLIKSKTSQIKEAFEASETRLRMQELLNTTAAKAQDQYEDIRDRLVPRIALLKSSLAGINEDKYQETITELVDELKKEGNFDTAQLKKLKNYLQKDFTLIKKSLS